VLAAAGSIDIVRVVWW